MRNKAVVGIASVGIAAVLAAAVLAFAVPEDHAVTRSAAYSRTPDQVFDVITSFADAASWRSELTAVTMLASDRYVESGPEGETEFRVLERRRPLKVVAEIAGSDLRGGVWTYEISAEGSGSRLTITDSGSIHEPITRVKIHYLTGHAAPLDRYLVDLGHHFGEDVIPR